MIHDTDEGAEKFVMPTNLLMHAMSHRMTYTENLLQVQRPRLHNTRLDPELYLVKSYQNSSKMNSEFVQTFA